AADASSMAPSQTIGECFRNFMGTASRGLGLPANAVEHAVLQARAVTQSSDLDLPAQFDDAVGGDAKEFGGIERIVGHQDEQLLAPTPQRRAAPAGDELLAADDERCLH